MCSFILTYSNKTKTLFVSVLGCPAIDYRPTLSIGLVRQFRSIRWQCCSSASSNTERSVCRSSVVEDLPSFRVRFRHSDAADIPHLSETPVIPSSLQIVRGAVSLLLQVGTPTVQMAFELTEQKKVGLGLIGFGIFFAFLGVILFFDRGLLALANIICLSGVAILLGWKSTWNLFTNRANYRGTTSFLLGLFFIFVRWPILGIILQVYGCFVIFSGFGPSITVFLYHIPVVGWIIQYPVQLLGGLKRSFS